MKKFAEWIKMKEEYGQSSSDMNLNISKAVKDMVGDKTGNPKNMAKKGSKAAALLRTGATQAAGKGDYGAAIKSAIDAAKIDQIAKSIK